MKRFRLTSNGNRSLGRLRDYSNIRQHLNYQQQASWYITHNMTPMTMTHQSASYGRLDARMSSNSCLWSESNSCICTAWYEVSQQRWLLSQTPNSALRTYRWCFPTLGDASSIDILADGKPTRIQSIVNDVHVPTPWARVLVLWTVFL